VTAGDSTLAERLTHEHINQSRERLLAHFDRSPE
jgi:DNA-binding GntR family transcriptional regulator